MIFVLNRTLIQRRFIFLMCCALLMSAAPVLTFAQERGISTPTDDTSADTRTSGGDSASAIGAPLPRDPQAVAAALGDTTQADRYVPQADGVLSHVSHYVIPRKIKVGITPYAHCGDWLNAGQPITDVIELDFDEYVKMVLPNEWPNSWHPESLKAGAVAVKTFAWWRMTLTNPRPLGADVVDNTCDQRFILNSKRPTTDAAVDETWPYRMSRAGLIKNVHYLDTDERCASTPILRPCMGQWGTRYMAEDGYNWQQILHHYYDPTDISLTNPIPTNVQTLTNGDFGAGASGWSTWGPVAGVDASGGMYRFHRTANSGDPAVLLQDINYEVATRTPIQITLQLGNSSNSTKQVSVHLHDTDHWDGVLSCAFTLYPGSPPLDFSLKGVTTEDFHAVRLEIIAETADGKPSYLVDNVTLKALDSDFAEGEAGCVEPVPGVPTVSTPTVDQRVHNQFNLVVKPGQSNYRPGYNAQFRVQINTKKSFATPLYDNESALATATSIPLTLEDGIYFVRVKQFDGIDRFGKWGAPVRFTVLTFPGKPTLVAPIDSVDGRNLTFSWIPSTDTDEYVLKIYNSSNVQIITKKLLAGACAATCSIPASVLSKPLEDNVLYRWQVMARNSEANKNSVRKNFTPDMPGMPALLTPLEGETVASDFTATWSEVSAADFYRIVIKKGSKIILNKKLLVSEVVCVSSSCSASPAALGAVFTEGLTYKWQVKAIRQTPYAVSSTLKRAVTILSAP